MDPLTVKNVIVKPTLAVVVEFEPVPNNKVRYQVVASAGEVDYTATAEANEAMATIPYIPHGTNVVITVVCGTSSGAPYAARVAIVTTTSAVLRQQVYDLLIEAQLSIAGRQVVVAADRYGRPRLLVPKDPLFSRTPVVEIGVPLLASMQQGSGVRRVETYRIPLTSIEGYASDFDSGLQRCILLLDSVRNAVDNHLNEGINGMVDASWTWADENPEYDDQLVSIASSFALPTQVMIGKLPYES